MKIILSEGDKYVLRFEVGDELLSGLEDFCKNRDIHSAFFYGLGAAKEGTIASYYLEEKKYAYDELDGEYEIGNVTGNVSEMDGDLIVHAHGSFGFKDKPARIGHINKLVVAATCEIFLTVFKNGIRRGPDQETGLNLMEPVGRD